MELQTYKKTTGFYNLNQDVDAGNQRNRKAIIESYLPFMLLFSQYSIGPVSLGYAVLGVISLWFLSTHDWRIVLHKDSFLFIIFIAYVFIRDLSKIVLGTVQFQTQLNRVSEYIIVFIFVLIVCQNGFDENRLYKAWKIAGIIFSIGLLYQLFLIHILGQSVATISIIPGYLIRDGVASDRPSSFFSEPAAFATAMIPLVFLALRKNEYITAAWATAAILATTSTVGTALSIIVWGVSLFVRAQSRIKKMQLFAVLAIIVVAFFNMGIFDDALIKSVAAVRGGTTFGIRVVAAFEYIKALSPIELIFGSNVGEASTFVQNHINSFSRQGVVMRYWNTINFAYTNTFGQLILFYGIIGLALFCFPLISLFSIKGYQAKVYIIVIFAQIFGQSALLSANYFLNIMILLLFCGAADKLNGQESWT